MNAQYEIVEQAEKNPSLATKKVAFFDAEGNPVNLGGSGSEPVTYDEGTLADLVAGTSEEPLLWSAKTIADFVAQAIADAADDSTDGGE